MFRKSVILVVAVVLLVVSAFLTSAQGENPLPEPTGPYDVGRTIYHLIDEDRPEVLTETEDDVRELLVYAFYPAEVPDDAVPAPYVRDSVLNVYSELPDAWFSDVASSESLKPHSYENAPIFKGDAPYPVILFLSGFDAPPWLYTAFVEELASHGYVVLTASHPYHSEVVAFPDGRVIAKPQADFYPDEVIEIWSADTQSILDEFANLNENDALWAGTLDLEHIGIVGHSIGGTVSLWMAKDDDRIDAVVNLDGAFQWEWEDHWHCNLCQDFWETPIDLPLIIMSGFPHNVVNMPEGGLIKQGTFLQLVDANHLTFSDIPLVREANLTERKLDYIDTINAYMTAFFDEHVKGIEGAMLEEDSDNYPDVRLLEIE